MTEASTLAAIAAVATSIGPYVYDAIKMLADKGAAEPVTQPLRDWFRRRYDQKRDVEGLREAVLQALAAIEPVSDEWENLLAALKLTGLNASQARLVAAAAIEMRVNSAEALPDDLFTSLNLDPSRRELLGRFLFELRRELAKSKVETYKDAIDYVDRLDDRGLLVGLTQNTLYLIALLEKRLSNDAVKIKMMHLTDDDGKALRAYLTYVREKWEVLPLPLLRKEKYEITQGKLKQIFVPLTLSEEHTEEKAQAEVGKRPRKSEVSPEQDSVEKNILSMRLGDLLDKHQRFILLGRPGCGKSTLLQRAALAFAEGREAADLEWSGRPLLPIFIRLRNFAVWLEKQDDYCDPLHGALVAYLENFYRKGCLLDLTPDFFERRLASGDCIVLLDGLDEVTRNRSEVVQQVNAFIMHYAPRGNHIGLASRPKGYRPEAELALRRSELVSIDVNPLPPQGIRDLVWNLFALIEHDPTKRDQDAHQLSEAISANSELVEIAGTPLFCSALVLVSRYRSAKLPKRRVDVLEEIVDLLLGFWKNQDDALKGKDELAIQDGTAKAHRDIDVAVDLKRLRLSYLARRMQEELNVAQIEVKQAVSLMIEYFLANERAPTPEIAEEWARGFLENSHERSGLLVQLDPGEYAFLHKAFMEYLAARALVDQSKTLVDTMLAHVGDEWWEPVILLAGAHSATPKDLRQELILRLLATAQEKGLTDSEGINHLLTAGKLARDMGDRLPGGELEQVEEALQAAMWDAGLAPASRALAADIFDELDRQPDDLYQFVHIPEQSQHESLLKAFWIGKYPVTNVQYERFLKQENFADESLWKGFPKYGEDSQPITGEDWGDEGWQWVLEALKDDSRSPDGRIVFPRYWHEPRLGIARKTVPVVGVTWYEAMAYCRWLERNWSGLEESAANALGFSIEVRLPREIEWETAAGKQEWVKAKLEKQWGNAYPWDAPGTVTTAEAEILRRANTSESQIGRTTPVGMYPLGVSQPYELWDLAGNIWEWQVNFFDKDQDVLGLRGGSWNYDPVNARPSVRNFDYPDRDWGSSGFRVLVLPSKALVS